jgi:hypothetical protein
MREVGSDIKLLDSFNGTPLQTFNGHMNSKQLPLGREHQLYVPQNLFRKFSVLLEIYFLLYYFMDFPP